MTKCDKRLVGYILSVMSHFLNTLIFGAFGLKIVSLALF